MVSVNQTYYKYTCTWSYFLLREKEEEEKEAESSDGKPDKEVSQTKVKSDTKKSRDDADDEDDDIADLYDLAHYDSDEDLEGNLNEVLLVLCILFFFLWYLQDVLSSEWNCVFNDYPPTIPLGKFIYICVLKVTVNKLQAPHAPVGYFSERSLYSNYFSRNHRKLPST